MTRHHAIDQLFNWPEWPDQLRSSQGLGDMRFQSLKTAAIDALSCEQLDQKIHITRAMAYQWFDGTLGIGAGIDKRPPDRPGRPEKPNLVAPNRTKKRSIRSQRGRIALLHAIAHIELNAIDLALDIIARFAHPGAGDGARRTGLPMPRSFFDGWVRVALEEAKHFSLLRQRLNQLDAAYGDLDAHDGLWEAAQSTGYDLTARLAVVPLILEARGLDITPSLLTQIRAVGDWESAAIFEIIYRDEQGHVAVGAKWFRYLCLRSGVDPAATFQTLVRKHFRVALKPPFNDFARARAGLTPGFYRALSSAGT